MNRRQKLRQPDSGPSQPAGKAKEDLLAAERAFDEEDDADKGGGKKCLGGC